MRAICDAHNCLATLLLLEVQDGDFPSRTIEWSSNAPGYACPLYNVLGG